jgi:Tol biopolymer transport system component
MMTRRSISSLLLILCLCLLVMALTPANLSAQYFGQNKVRYESHDFKVLKTEHYDIHYYDEAADVAIEAGRMAERWYVRLSKALGHELPPNQPIILYASHPAFRATAILPDTIGESTGGVTEGLRRRVILPVAGPLAETDHVLGHELVHAFQYDIAAGAGGQGLLNLPLWFIEGMAEYLSLGHIDSNTAMWMRDAVRREDFPTVKNLNNSRYFPYRFGQAFWAFVGGRYGDDKVGPLLKAAGGMGIEGAIQQFLGVSAEEFSTDWQNALVQDYSPILDATAPPEEQAQPVILAQENKGALNIAPVISPDGSEMVFFSERGLFSIDLFVADVQTGRIKRKLTETAIDPHIDSLQFVNSAGAWSADGGRFAFGTIAAGRPELLIQDVAGDRIAQRIRFPQFGEIFNLTWSPDGQRIAFSAMSEGVADLFIVDLQTEMVRQITNDAFADLQPAWSPDGNRIAFVTDRFTADLATLSFGPYRLGLLDVATGGISAAPGFNSGKHLNPQWSPDGASLYFVSDRDGISNIYRLSTANGALNQVTNVQTGVSGISSLSPAFSVAAKANRMVFSTFAEGNYSIYKIDEPARLAGGSPSSAVAELNAATLPPRSGVTREITAVLGNATQGLTSSQSFAQEPYKARLGLDYIAPPSVSVGVGDYGSMIGGGTAFSWSDLLGYHNLTTTVQTSFSSEQGNFLNNFAAVASYANQKSRWTWGLAGGQVPYTSGGYSRVIDTSGQPVVIDRSEIYWQINRELAGIFSYPFNRAQRLEFSSGYRHVSFAAESRRQVYSLITGQLISDQSIDIPTLDALNMATASTALVYDTSIFGGTSPVTGQRYRFELETTAGSLNYRTFLGDYRKYFQLARPLSIAGRLLHYGRYGGGSEDARLQDIFLGSESLVRGYAADSFTVDECGTLSETSTSCPVFDQLIGSRIAVASAEVRVPIFGVLGVIRSPSVPPVETALFYDAGVAWTSVDEANFLGGSRRPVTSVGGTLRVNILGFAIGQISYVHPNDRPAKRWVWEFSLNAGF